MANQNLSQFGEKLFVADADHTFIWDSAASISKRVSRNSWLNSGTLTSDAPVTISQTWNAGSNVMTALKVVATDTVSGTTSNLLSLDLSTNNVLGEKWRFKFEKSGLLKTTGNIELGIGLAASSALLMGNGFYAVGGGNGLYMGGGVGGYILNHGATQLWRGSADHILEQRNGAAAQTFRVYKSYLNAGVDYERLSFSHDGVQFGIGTERAGSGIAQPLRFFGGSSAALDFANGVSFRNASGGTTFMTVASSGNVGIGTTAPGAKLDVSGGTVRIEAGSAQGFGQRVSVLTFYRSDIPTTYLNKITSSASGILNQSAITFDLANGPSTTVTPFQVTADQTVGLGGNISNNDLLGASMVVKAGNVGIGTTSPTSKLQVSAGDVEVDTIAKGVILKSPDGTRYRVTVANGGTLSVAAV